MESSGSAAVDTTATATVTFAATADARVEEANPTTNYGTKWLLGTDGDAGLRIESDLRFELSGLAGTVESAKLRLYVGTNPTTAGPSVYPAGGDWSETGVTWATRAEATGAAVGEIGAAAVDAWVEVDVTRLVTGNGTVNIVLKETGTDGLTLDSRESTNRPQLVVTTADSPPPPADPVVMAAGDIACAPGSTVTATTCRHRATSDLLIGEPALAKVLALGDEQYEDGLYSEFTGAGAYDGAWGRVRSMTAPSPGNHEYHTSGAAGYFDYFGAAAGEQRTGYYSFDLGSWHLISLDSEIATAVGSAQEQWLRRDLATTTKACVLAYWHRPRFSSGEHGPTPSVGPLWSALYAAHADLVLSGHDHDYERFALQNPSGQPDPNGIRQFVVGTGGASHYAFAGTIQPNSELRNSTTFGVLKLTLHASSYDWRFVPEPGSVFTDSGSTPCHRPRTDSPPVASLTVEPSVGAAPTVVTADASASTDTDQTPIASYSFDFGDGSPAVGPQGAPVAAHAYTTAGTYSVRVTVTDTGGLVGRATQQVVVEPNLVRNAGFEADVAGWNTSGSGPGIGLSHAFGGHTGASAAVLTNAGDITSTCTLNDSPNWVTTTSATTFTGTLWVRADTPGTLLKLRFREWSGLGLGGSATSVVSLTTSWRQVSVTYTPVLPGSSTLDFNAYVVGAPPGTCFYADDAAVYAVTK